MENVKKKGCELKEKEIGTERKGMGNGRKRDEKWERGCKLGENGMGTGREGDGKWERGCKLGENGMGTGRNGDGNWERRG